MSSFALKNAVNIKIEKNRIENSPLDVNPAILVFPVKYFLVVIDIFIDYSGSLIFFLYLVGSFATEELYSICKGFYSLKMIVFFIKGLICEKYF